MSYPLVGNEHTSNKYASRRIKMRPLPNPHQAACKCEYKSQTRCVQLSRSLWLVWKEWKQMGEISDPASPDRDWKPPPSDSSRNQLSDFSGCFRTIVDTRLAVSG